MISMRLSTRRGSFTATVVAFAVLAASCGGGSDSSATDVNTVPNADVAATTVENDAPAAETDAAGATDAPELMQFTSPLVGGGELDAATLATKPTAFWFWSPT